MDDFLYLLKSKHGNGRRDPRMEHVTPSEKETGRKRISRAQDRFQVHRRMRHLRPCPKEKRHRIHCFRPGRAAAVSAGVLAYSRRRSNHLWAAEECTCIRRPGIACIRRPCIRCSRWSYHLRDYHHYPRPGIGLPSASPFRPWPSRPHRTSP